MDDKNKNTILSGYVESWSYGGRGIVKVDDKVYFVTGGYPGDKVSFRVTKSKKSFGEGEVTQIISPSQQRTENPCQYSDKCGSCQWLGSDYLIQSSTKEKFIVDAMNKFGGLDVKKLDGFYASPKKLGYRNRVRLHVEIKKKNLTLGYFARKSHKIIPITRCEIADPNINHAIQFISSINCSSLDQKDKANFEVSLQVLESKKVLCRFITKQQRLPKSIYALIQDFIQTAKTDIIFDQLHSTSRELHIIDLYKDLSYSSFGEQFQQVNTEGNHLLRTKISEICEVLNPKSIIDLYCGSGNLSLHLNKKDRTVIGIERNPKSIIAANKNVENNNLKNLHYHAMDSEEFLGQKIKQYLPIDLLILDPPRQGLGDFVDDLPQYNTQNIIYVSCDPNTLARDTAKITDMGYQLEEIWGFDFFPQTYHIETLALFKKS